MGVNKVVYGNTTLIDISSDTVDASHLASGYTAHLPSGIAVTGTASYTYDSQTEELTVPSWAVELE